MEAVGLSSTAHCPLCRGGPTTALIELRGFPALQSVFSASREAAIALDCDDVELRYCADCHFAFNPTPQHRPERIWADYDNKQLASKRYRGYLESVADQLCTRFALTSASRVLEPACGDGYLLARLRAHCGATIMGFDPRYGGEHGVDAYVERSYLQHPVTPACDLIVLRHVVELAEPLDKLLEAVVGSLHPAGHLYLELTDLDQALRRGATALFSREYLRYYSLHAISRALLGFGLSIVEALPGFGGDYLQVVAQHRPALAKLRSGLERVNTLIDEHDKVVIWGMGGRAVSALLQSGWNETRVHYGVDSDGGKQGRFAPVTGQRILSPEQARHFGPDLVIVANALYLEEIRASLAQDCLFVTLDGDTHG